MIPQNEKTALSEISFATLPSQTYALNFDQNVINGKIDGIEAIRQTVYLILCTERYQYLIHSWNYGVELTQLIGKPIALVLPEVERCIKEALTQDDRITDVDSFSFEINRSKVHCTFTVHSIFGDTIGETEVPI